MIELLKECCKKHKVISLYNDSEDTCKHFTGYVGTFDERDVLIQHISTHGLYDGYIIIPKDTIYQLSFDGKYEKKIEKLYRIKKQRHETIEIEDKGILFSILAFAKKKKYVICVELQDSMLSGFVKDYNKKTICIEEITEFGECDGECVIQMEKINIVSVDTDDEQDILLLMNK